MSARDREDDALAAAFAELRAEERRASPTFASIRARHSSRHGERSLLASPLVRLAAAALVLVVAGTAYRAARVARFTVPREVLALTAWRPATEVLLETPGSELLRYPTNLGASLLTLPSLDTRSTGDNR